MGKINHRLTGALLVGLLASPTLTAAPEPAALQQLRDMGVQFTGTFPAKGGLTAWAGYHGDQPLAVYEAPDGEHIILGRILDAEGRDVNQTALEQQVGSHMSTDVWERLAQSNWITDGAADAPMVAYVFTDLNCPYCNKLWVDARPWIDSGKLQLRHILVGIIRENSAAKAATLLTAENAEQQLGEHARLHMEAGDGRIRPISDEGVPPMAGIPAPIQAQLDANHTLMAELGLRATPAVVWLDESGKLHKQTGAPDSLLPHIAGPIE